MKKAILPILILALSAVRATPQGQINYNIRVVGAVVAHVYGPELTDPTIAKVGNTASETPSGTQTYTGALLAGSGWYALLFAAPGTGQSEAALTLVPTSTTSFRTGATLGGTIGTSTQTIPQVSPGAPGTFQLRVWDNLGGTVTSWPQAESLWGSGVISAAKSPLFDVPSLGDDFGGPVDMLNFRSFNVYRTPEPSAFALAGLGAAALWLFRRR